MKAHVHLVEEQYVLWVHFLALNWKETKKGEGNLAALARRRSRRALLVALGIATLCIVCRYA